jgi:hypothetical protein
VNKKKKINTQACYDFNWSDEAVKHVNILQSQIYSEKSTNNSLYYTLNETVFCEVTQGNCSSWSGRSTTWHVLHSFQKEFKGLYANASSLSRNMQQQPRHLTLQWPFYVSNQWIHIPIAMLLVNYKWLDIYVIEIYQASSRKRWYLNQESFHCWKTAGDQLVVLAQFQ